MAERKLIHTHSQPWEHRKMVVDALNTSLLMIEIILAGEAQRFSHKSVDLLKAHDLYRQQLKRAGNELLETANSLQRRCDITDREELMEYVTRTEPAFRQAYMEDGGGMTTRLQAAYYRVSGDITNRIYIQSKNLIDRCKMPHSDLIANVMTVVSVAQTGIEVYEFIMREQDRLVSDRGRVRRRKSGHHERMLCCARTIINTLMPPNPDLPEVEARQARELVRQMQVYLSDKYMEQICRSTIDGAVIEYIEYSIASMCVMMHQSDSLPADVEDRLLRLLGTENRVFGLKRELRAIPLPCHASEVDVWEFAQQLPAGNEVSMLTLYRRTCAESRSLTKEDWNAARENYRSHI